MNSFPRAIVYIYAFTELARFNCTDDEEIRCMTTISIESTLFLCVGSFQSRAGEVEPKEGNIMVFRVEQPSHSTGLQLSLAHTAEVSGCVYCISTINGLIVAGVNSAVSVRPS